MSVSLLERLSKFPAKIGSDGQRYFQHRGEVHLGKFRTRDKSVMVKKN